MTNIDGVIIILGLAYGIYKFYELSTRRKDREAMIEKMSCGEILYFSLMLLFGGLGLVIGYVIDQKKTTKEYDT